MLSKRPEKNITSTYCYLTCNNKRHLAIRDYLPELRRARAARDKSLQDIKDESMNRLMKDIAIDRAENPGAPLEDRWNSDDEGDDDGDINIIDKSMFIAPSFFLLFTLFLTESLHSSGEEPWPGQYIDVTRARRHGDEDINWPRPS